MYHLTMTVHLVCLFGPFWAMVSTRHAFISSCIYKQRESLYTLQNTYLRLNQAHAYPSRDMSAATKIGVVFGLLQLFLSYVSSNLGRSFLLLCLIYNSRLKLVTAQRFQMGSSNDNILGLTYFFCATSLKDHLFISYLISTASKFFQSQHFFLQKELRNICIKTLVLLFICAIKNTVLEEGVGGTDQKTGTANAVIKCVYYNIPPHLV